MDHSPLYTRFANGLSTAVLIVVLMACGYVFGKKIRIAEAAGAQQASDTGSGQPGSTRPNPSNGSGQAGSAKSDSDSAKGKGVVPENLEAMDASDGRTPVKPTEIGRRDTIATGVVPTGSIEGVQVSGDVVLGASLVAADADLLEFNATAYCLPGYTATGIVAHRGTIAADPLILPLGSVVHLRAGDYSGTYLVLDTGAKIKGRKIDIYMPDRREAINFGRRAVRLKVLGRVPPSHLQPK